MTDHEEEDLDLLLSLQDRVVETPPGSPSDSSDYQSDDGLLSGRRLRNGDVRKRRVQVDMSVFKDAVKDCLDYEPKLAEKLGKMKRPKTSNDVVVEKFSGLRIRNQVIDTAELRGRFSDIRFARLSTIKNLLVGDTLSGCWATAGVLIEKGIERSSSTGKSYSIWKFGCLNEQTISTFLFGNAYKSNAQEREGTVFALFNSSVRRDEKGTGFSLSVYSPSQILKIGTSADYGVCQGKRKDGITCTVVINKCKGIYCTYHKSKSSQKFPTMRTELKGGNLRSVFRDPLQSEGIYMVDPLADKTNLKGPSQPVKLLSVEGLKKALSNADKVTTNTHSQGIRFLAQLTGKKDPESAIKELKLQNQPVMSVEKRKSSATKMDPCDATRSRQQESKRKKTEDPPADKNEKKGTKMIELEVISSDDETDFLLAT